MLAGVLDAVDLTAIACCSRELHAATDDIWEGVRAKNPATSLRSVERHVDDLTQNQSNFTLCAPVELADACVVCGKLTRFRQPVDGWLLCAPCGTSAESAPVWSPLFRFRMVAQDDARKMYKLSSAINLCQHLPYDAQNLSNRLLVSTYTTDGKSTSRYVCKFAACFVANVKEALTAESAPSATNTMCVFLLQDVSCLVLEKFGGPKLLEERICSKHLPPLSVANPNE